MREAFGNHGGSGVRGWMGLAACLLFGVSAAAGEAQGRTIVVHAEAVTGEWSGKTTPSALQKALDDARPGDVVRLAPGRHVGLVTMRKGGVKDHPVTLEGQEGAYLDAGVMTRFDWKPRPEVAEGVYSAKVPFYPGQLVVDGKMVVMFREDRASVETDDGGVKKPLWQVMFRDGIKSNERNPYRWDGVKAVSLYFKKSQEFFIRFADKSNPADKEISLTPVEPAVLVDGADRCVVRDLEIRNAYAGVQLTKTVGSVVEGCDINRTRHGVELAAGADRCTVRFNEITQTPLGVNWGRNVPSLDGLGFSVSRDWSLAWDLWTAHKRWGHYDSRGIEMRGSVGGHRIHDNHIFDHFDGIGTSGGDWTKDAKARLARPDFNVGVDVHHNLIEFTNDDSFDLYDHGVDQRFHHNMVRNARCAFRIKPTDKGPFYAYGNQFVLSNEDVRFYGELELNPGEVYVYHNSSTARRAINSNKVRGVGTPNFHVFNNLFWTESWWGNSTADEPNWQADYNVYVRRGSLDAWGEQRKLAEKLKLDAHSRWIEGAASPFVNAADDDLRLAPDSPAIGAGGDLAKLAKRPLPGAAEFVRDGKVDAGALPLGSPAFKVPRPRAEVGAEPAGSWPE